MYKLLNSKYSSSKDRETTSAVTTYTQQQYESKNIRWQNIKVHFYFPYLKYEKYKFKVTSYFNTFNQVRFWMWDFYL